MRERPILFSAPMVRAILAGTKTQTRRVVKFKPIESELNLGFSGLDAGLYHCGRPDAGWVLRSRDGAGRWNDRTHPLRCPYGAPGDRLWVREAFALAPACSDPDPDYEDDWHVVYRATEDDPDVKWIDADGKAVSPWKPSIHMPRWASRITLEVTGVRVERLWDISEEDAKAEGVEPMGRMVRGGGESRSYRQGFDSLWVSLNGPDSFAANTFVWVVEFKRIEAQERAA